MKALTRLDRALCRILDSSKTRKLADIGGIGIIIAIYASAYWWF